VTGSLPRSAAILYFSGTGGTEIVAQLLGELLREELDCSISSIEEAHSRELAGKRELIVVCYPTYYLKCAPSMREFVEGMPAFDPPRPAYVVTTCELYTENSIRRMALILKEKGLVVSGSKAIHAPGSDVTLALPSGLIPWWYRFEKGFPKKLRAAAEDILTIARDPEIREAIPRAKWYTPFTQLLQLLFLNHFDLFRKHVRVIGDRCSSCGECVAMCRRGAWTMGREGPLHHPELCELCGRCMHRCPGKAIVILRMFRDNRRIDAHLMAALRDDARSALKEASNGK